MFCICNFGISWFLRIWTKRMGTTAPVPIEGSATGEHRHFGALPPVSTTRPPRFFSGELSAGAPDFQVQGAALLLLLLPRRSGRTDARSGADDGRESWRTQRTPKNSRAGPARPGCCWNSLELVLSLVLTAQIANRWHHRAPLVQQCLCRNHLLVHNSGQFFTAFDTETNNFNSNTDWF